MNIMLVGRPVLPLYAAPDSSTEVVSQALYGQSVTTLAYDRDFQLIQTGDGYRGWVEGQHLRPADTLTQPPYRLKIACQAAPVYPHPQVKHHPLWVLPFEVALPVLAEPEEEERRWIQVQLVEGKRGWIQRGHVSWHDSALTLTEMIEMSRQFLGLPYIWGGTSSFGFDCSGFIQMLVRQTGRCLPRDARDQCAVCRPVDADARQAGDLLFYGATEKEIAHVALYLGAGRLIHAAVQPRPLLQEAAVESPDLLRRFAYQTVRRFY